MNSGPIIKVLRKFVRLIEGSRLQSHTFGSLGRKRIQSRSKEVFRQFSVFGGATAVPVRVRVFNSSDLEMSLARFRETKRHRETRSERMRSVPLAQFSLRAQFH